MFIESQYDTWAIKNILKIDCAKQGIACSTLKYCSAEEMSAIQSYRNQYMNLISSKVKSSQKANSLVLRDEIKATESSIELHETKGSVKIQKINKMKANTAS